MDEGFSIKDLGLGTAGFVALVAPVWQTIGTPPQQWWSKYERAEKAGKWEKVFHIYRMRDSQAFLIRTASGMFTLLRLGFATAALRPI